MADKRIATAIEPYKATLARLEAERDEAFQAAADWNRQVPKPGEKIDRSFLLPQHLEK